MSAPRPARSSKPREYFLPAFYARVSTHDQDTELQLREGRRWIDYQRLPKAVEYVDQGWSGAKNSRPDFDKLMKAALSGKHDLIVVWKLDRFGRNTRHLLDNVQKLSNAGVRFVSIMDNIDTDEASPMGQLMLTILAAFAEFERATTMERSTAGRDRKFADGLPDSWNLGYGFHPGKPLVKEPEAEMIRHLFKWRSEEYSVREIEEFMVKLAERIGAPLPRSGKFGNSTMIGWLKNRQYRGEFLRCDKVYPLPLIIPVELFDEVQAKMAATARKNSGNPALKFELSGILFGECGGAMVGRTPVDCARHYRCQGHQQRSKLDTSFVACSCANRKAAIIDDVVWKEVWKLLLDPERLRRNAEAFARAENAKNPPLGKAPREKLAALQAKEQRIIANFTEGDITIEQKRGQLATVREEMVALKAEIAAMGKVIEIAPRDLVAETCEAIRRGAEPTGLNRRIVYENLLDFQARLEGSEVVITGKVPVGKSVKSNAGNTNNPTEGLTSLEGCYDPMPFILRAKVAA